MTSRVSSSQSADSQWSHQDPPEATKDPKAGLGTKIKNGWAKLELDIPTVTLMMKLVPPGMQPCYEFGTNHADRGAIPPTVALAA